MKFELRVLKDASRPSMHLDADGVEIYWKIGAAPISPADCTEKDTFSTATVLLKINLADAGKRMGGYARWKNISDTNKSGPWSQIFSIVIGS